MRQRGALPRLGDTTSDPADLVRPVEVAWKISFLFFFLFRFNLFQNEAVNIAHSVLVSCLMRFLFVP